MELLSCPYAKLFVSGNGKYLRCAVTKDLCCHQRYCAIRRTPTLTISGDKCVVPKISGNQKKD